MGSMRLLKWLIVFLVVLQLPFLYSLLQTYQLHRYLVGLSTGRAELSAPFQDLRGAMHVERPVREDRLSSSLEIVQAAREARYRYLFLSRHPENRSESMPFQDPGIVVIYGYEEEREGSLRILSRHGSALFLTHLSGDVIPDEATGLELFNLHENLQKKDDWYYRTKRIYHRIFFPSLFFFHIWELDPGRFRLWDGLLERQQLTGIAGAGPHQDRSDSLPTTSISESLFSIRNDSYLKGFGSVTTHVLLPVGETTSEEGILRAFRRGSAYIAFERIADPTGFSFHAEEGGRAVAMGAEVKRGSRLIFQSPLPVRFLLMRDASRHKELQGRRFVWQAGEPGVYRLEVYPLYPPALLVGKPWIISNPIFVNE